MTEGALTLITSSVIGLVTSFITALITYQGQIEQARINAIAELLKHKLEEKGDLSEKEKEEVEEEINATEARVPSSTLIRWILAIIGTGVLITLLLWVIFWLWPTKVPQSTPAYWVDSFEARKIAPEWTIGRGSARLRRSRKFVFSGRHSLRVDAELKQSTSSTSPADIVQLELVGREIQDKVAVFRVYVPKDAPTNVEARLYIGAKDDPFIGGRIEKLSVGEWTTLAWRTQDAPEWQTPATLGIQFALLDAQASTDETAYNGPIYVDLVELLDCPDRYVEQSILEPIISYDFQREDHIPGGFELAGDAKDFSIAEGDHLSSGERALRLDLALTPYKNENYGGFAVDLQDIPHVDALSILVFIPGQGNEKDDSFEVSFVAIDGNDEGVYGGGVTMPVGRWSPYFWGTRYAYVGVDYCKDENSDDKCDKPAGLLWHAWKETNIKKLYFRVWRNGESYGGPVYVDDLVVYQVRR
jgi:hypothetical protein